MQLLAHALTAGRNRAARAGPDSRRPGGAQDRGSGGPGDGPRARHRQRGARDPVGYVAEMRGKAKLIAEGGPVPANGHYVAPVAFEVGSIRELPGERFGPVLHVARFAVERIGPRDRGHQRHRLWPHHGVHSRIDSRVEYIRRRARVGNLYVNRNMIGAVVGSSPLAVKGFQAPGPRRVGLIPWTVHDRTCRLRQYRRGGWRPAPDDARSMKCSYHAAPQQGRGLFGG